MPVTAKLSRGFYERFGDELTNELVDWLNAVDATYRSDLRETNELNFARFMASVDQRFAEQDARIEKRFAEQGVAFDKRFVAIDSRFAELDTRLEKRFGQIDARFGDLRADLLKWMFIYWTGTMLAMAGFVFSSLR
jgi:hypothetical protein